MATHSVNDVASLINNQIALHEKIQDFLFKAEALASVAVGSDFLDSDQYIISEYLGVLFDLIVESKDLHQSALDNLTKFRRRDWPVD